MGVLHGVVIIDDLSHRMRASKGCFRLIQLVEGAWNLFSGHFSIFPIAAGWFGPMASSRTTAACRETGSHLETRSQCLL
eukprot:376862-Amphidinium_carterae.1